eukprot:15211-Heterococcus_DN1.PRE.1
MVRELEKVHGPVLHVVLPTLAIEHKDVRAGSALHACRCTTASMTTPPMMPLTASVIVGNTPWPFSRQFPQSQAWVMPGQYSYPINLPTQWLGFGSKPIKLLPESAVGAPWEKEVRTVPRNIPKSLDHALLGPLLSRDGIGAYGEATFLYKPTGTLLVTDVVIQVDEDIPAIVELGDPRALLFHARDDALQLIEDTPQIRTKGWKRIQQFGLFFQPSSLEVEPLGQALLKTAPKSPMKNANMQCFSHTVVHSSGTCSVYSVCVVKAHCMQHFKFEIIAGSELGWFGLFPFTWGGASLEESSYRALQKRVYGEQQYTCVHTYYARLSSQVQTPLCHSSHSASLRQAAIAYLSTEQCKQARRVSGGLVVAPILQTLILNRQPKEVLKYADTVARWPIKRLISCHLGNNVPSSGAAFRSAFRFLEDDYVQPTRTSAPLFSVALGVVQLNLGCRSTAVAYTQSHNLTSHSTHCDHSVSCSVASHVLLLRQLMQYCSFYKHSSFQQQLSP